HGAFVTPAAPPAAVGALERLARVRADLERNDHAHARAICDDVLREVPDHPYALDLLAQVEAASGNVAGALRTLLAAVDALPRHALPPAVAFGVWSTLNATYALALSRHDVASRDARERYNAWQAARSCVTRAQDAT